VRVQTVVLLVLYAHYNARIDSDIDLAVIAPQFARLNIRERYETLSNDAYEFPKSCNLVL
jgi:predicted nucleotidyltransferase